jgi:hypothetical protein
LAWKNWQFQMSITGEPVDFESNKILNVMNLLGDNVTVTLHKKLFVNGSYDFLAMMLNVRCSFEKAT